MNLDTAGQAHSEWKVKLRMAISRQEMLDAVTIAKDNCCPLGQWLHGEARSKYGSHAAYRDCITKHAEFHRQAGAVAQVINQKDFARAGKMLDAGTPYAAASSAIGSAILALKKAVPATA